MTNIIHVIFLKYKTLYFHTNIEKKRRIQLNEGLSSWTTRL